MDFVIKDWFISKIEVPHNAHINRFVFKVIKETDKAMCCILEIDKGEWEGTVERWIPKSCLMTLDEYFEERNALEERYNAGCERYNQLVKWCHENNVRGVRVGLRTETINKLIEKAGLQVPAL